ncbi:MAG TPA: Ig-like domain-containing protein [Sedimentibacter sp.]|nr:Ig-like domain-containing protein [Sedimentibacter sp.]
MTPEELILGVGQKGKITATVSPSNATNKKVNWSSSDEDVATVDENGNVTAVAVGTATITAISDANSTKTATCDIRVISENANVEAQDFGVMDFPGVMGYSVGFKLIDATASDVKEVVVKLCKGEEVLATNTSAGVLHEYVDATSLSAPFDVFGNFDYEEDGCWDYSGWQGYTSDIPDKAEITVTFKNGVVRTAINENLTGDISIFDVGTITKTAFWGTPDNVLYYFDFELGSGFKIGDLKSLVAKAYAGDTLLSTISLKTEKFTEYANRTSLGGSFRSNPEASPSSSWNLEAFDGTMPTEIVVEYVQDGKTYSFGIKDIEWINEGFKPVSNSTKGLGYNTIQEAINAAEERDTILIAAGTYEVQQIKISKSLTLIGLGDQSIIQATTKNAVLTLGTNDIIIKDLKLVGAEGTEKGAGIKIGSQVAINGLTIENCIIKDFTNGIFADTNKDAKPVVENVHIINSRFINNTLKGIYIEKLSESTIENCYFEGNGHEHYAGAGIDINAKYTEYSNIMIKGCTFVNNGTESSYGGGILIKERGTGDDSSYSSAPATLTNVTIEGCTFESNPKAIVLGEYGVKNTGPTSVVITNATYIGNSQDVVDYRKLNNEENLEKLNVTSFGRKELDISPIDAAIEAAKVAKEGITVSEDGTDVPAGTYWVTQMDMDALDAAIANAEAAKESAKTQQDVTNIVEELEAAVSTFNDAKQEVIDEEEIGEAGQGEELEE